MKWEYRGISPTGLKAMTDNTRTAMEAAGMIRRSVQEGRDPQPEDVAALAGSVDTLGAMVAQLCDEVDGLNWRATVANMALDGRLTYQDLQLHGGQP